MSELVVRLVLRLLGVRLPTAEQLDALPNHIASVLEAERLGVTPDPTG